MLRWMLLLVVVGCGGASERDDAPPASSSSSSCESFPWKLDVDAGDSLDGCAVPGDPACGLSWCGARQYEQTVFVGCSEAPRAACAPAELADRVDAWCCW